MQIVGILQKCAKEVDKYSLAVTIRKARICSYNISPVKKKEIQFAILSLNLEAWIMQGMLKVTYEILPVHESAILIIERGIRVICTWKKHKINLTAS